VIGAHAGDVAELYALGALDEVQRRRVDAHLRTCAQCRTLVGAAERDVAFVASMEPRHDPPPQLEAKIDAALAARAPWPLPLAIAAAIVIGLMPAAYLWSVNRALHATVLAQTAAMQRLAAGPHRHADFQPMQPSPPAEVMYGSDGSWYLIVVHDARKALAVAWMHDGERTTLGYAAPNGSVAMLYLPKSHRMDRLALMDGDRIVAQATLSWGKSSPARPAVRSG